MLVIGCLIFGLYFQVDAWVWEELAAEGWELSKISRIVWRIGGIGAKSSLNIAGGIRGGTAATGAHSSPIFNADILIKITIFILAPGKFYKWRRNFKL